MAEEQTQKPTPAKDAPPPAKTVDEICAGPLVAHVAAAWREAILDAKEFAGETTLTIARDSIADVCRAFKQDGFDYLVDLCGVDYSTYPGHTGERFAVVYQLYSFARNERLRLKAFTPDGQGVPSVTGVWLTANWHERETFDMFGIVFAGHPNLERILMWDGFNGHPLRKDFPLRGIDTGARIYPEVFPEGGGPREGSTGKDPSDVNLYQGEWNQYGISPVAQVPLRPQVEESAEEDDEEPPQDPSGGETPAGKEKDRGDEPAGRESSEPPAEPPQARLHLPRRGLRDAVTPPSAAPVEPAPAAIAAPAAGEVPWTDPALSIEERVAAAAGRPLADRLRARCRRTTAQRAVSTTASAMRTPWPRVRRRTPLCARPAGSRPRKR